MDSDEIEEAIARYQARLNEYGACEQALGWGVKGRSRLRFEVLLSRWPFEGASVLDFGCGFGDLFGYMQAKGIAGLRYTGVDINNALLDVARERYPQARFIATNLLEGSLFGDASFDYVLSSGVFNHRLRDNMAFISSAFAQFARVSTRGFASNFLSNKVDYRLEHTFHADPASILELAYAYSNNVVLRNDYMPFEFSVFVDKAARIDPEVTVYEDYVQFR